MNSSLIERWPTQNAQLWDQFPLHFTHRLQETGLFDRDQLIKLIDSYPREHYSIIRMGEQGAEKTWQEGDASNQTGQQIYDLVENGRLWINLRNVHTVCQDYQSLLSTVFGELTGKLSKDPFPNISTGILISSPNAQVYYHCDLPNQSLFQISGEKKIWVYPPTEPFLSGEDLERISIYELEVDMNYEPWFDDYAKTFDLRTGDALHWPLNAPHRVVNGDSVNVSVTSEYWSHEAKMRHKVNMANGMLRYRMGLTPKSRKTQGLGFWMKDRLDAVVGRTGWVEKARAKVRPIEFDLDASKSGDAIERKS